MNLVESYLKRPHLVSSLVLLAAVVGFVGYRRMPVNLFPDSERPQIAVVTVYPGASAQDVETEVTRTIEKELNTIDQVRRVTSVSKDEVSAVTVEFEYSKGLDSAATDVANALQKIKAKLPDAIRPPMLFKVSSATPAVMTLALRPKAGSPLDLSMVRQLADNASRSAAAVARGGQRRGLRRPPAGGPGRSGSGQAGAQPSDPARRRQR